MPQLQQNGIPEGEDAVPDSRPAVTGAGSGTALDRRRAADRARYHQTTQARRAAGLCLRCGRDEPVAGLTTCAACALKNRERERARNERLKAGGLPRRDPARRKAADRERYRKAMEDRAARGLCSRCGKAEPAPDKKLCPGCGDKVRTMARERYHRGKAAGLAYGGRRAASRRRSARIRSERRRRGVDRGWIVHPLRPARA